MRQIERVYDKSLWWRKDEMQEIRAECCLLVEEYTLYKGEFEKDVTFLMDTANDTNLAVYDEKELEFVRDHEVIRGLERHIVMEFETVKQTHFESIMHAQTAYRDRRTTERWKHLKKISLETSLATRYKRFALRRTTKV